MSEIGHNRAPETIEEIVLAAQQTRDLRDAAQRGAKNAEMPWLLKAEEAAKPFKAEFDRLHAVYGGLTTKIAKWQEDQREANPFAEPKDVSRVIIDGDVAATTRTVETIEIADPDKVPRQFCKPDEAKIRAELAMGREVPGVVKRVRYSVMVR